MADGLVGQGRRGVSLSPSNMRPPRYWQRFSSRADARSSRKSSPSQDRISGKKALAALDRISAEGGNFSNDDGYTRILAYSCPIVEASGRAVAALTVPLCGRTRSPPAKPPTIASELRNAAKVVSKRSAAPGAVNHPAVIPASTTHAAPLTCAASLMPEKPRHRQCFQAAVVRAGPAKAMGCAGRPSSSRIIRDSTGPGRTALTRMRVPTTSSAAVRVNPNTACLEAT